MVFAIGLQIACLDGANDPKGGIRVVDRNTGIKTLGDVIANLCAFVFAFELGAGENRSKVLISKKRTVSSPRNTVG